MKTPRPPVIASSPRPFGRDDGPCRIAFLVDAEGVIRSESPALSELCGLEGRPVRGRNWLDEFSPAGAAGAEGGIFARGGGQEGIWIYERQVLRADGKLVDVLVSAQGSGRFMSLEIEPLAPPRAVPDTRARKPRDAREEGSPGIDVRREARAIIARFGAKRAALAERVPAHEAEPREGSGLEDLPAALFIVGPDLGIRRMNAMGRALLPPGPPRPGRGPGIADLLPPGRRDRLCEIIHSCFEGSGPRSLFLDPGESPDAPGGAIWSMALNAASGEVVVLAIEAGEALRNASHPDGRFYDEFGLPAREREIVELLLEGYQYKEIAWKLSIRLPTVRTHLQRVYRKTGVHAKQELLAKAMVLAAPSGGMPSPGKRALISFRESP